MRRQLLLGTAAILLVLPVLALTKSPFLTGFKTRYAIANGDRLDTCYTCHVSGQPYSVQNPYGLDVKARNPGDDIDNALAQVEGLDSDGDGATNIVEILNRTFPGDPTDTTPVEASSWGAVKARYR